MTTSMLLLRLRPIRRVAAELPRTDASAAVVILAMLGVAQWRVLAWTGEPMGGSGSGGGYAAGFHAAVFTVL